MTMHIPQTHHMNPNPSDTYLTTSKQFVNDPSSHHTFVTIHLRSHLVHIAYCVTWHWMILTIIDSELCYFLLLRFTRLSEVLFSIFILAWSPLFCCWFILCRFILLALFVDFGLWLGGCFMWKGFLGMIEVGGMKISC